MSANPTIIFVAGAWHRASTWDKVTGILEAEQYKCVSIGLPSASDNASATFLDDLTAVRAAIEVETKLGLDVVVVVHSYGGIVGESAVKGFTKSPKNVDKAAEMASGHVIGLVMIATGFVATGACFMEATGGQPPPMWKADWDSGFATFVADPRPWFYHDLPEEEGQQWVEKLGNQSLKALYEGGEHVYAGWMDVPVFYCITLNDQALPAELQKSLPDMARQAGATVTVREIQSSHSPMLSKPEETVNIVKEAATAFRV
jgi:pimeloyl-ACP methyl ester carboxylesterase